MEKMGGGGPRLGGGGGHLGFGVQKTREWGATPQTPCSPQKLGGGGKTTDPKKVKQRPNKAPTWGPKKKEPKKNERPNRGGQRVGWPFLSTKGWGGGFWCWAGVLTAGEKKGKIRKGKALENTPPKTPPKPTQGKV